MCHQHPALCPQDVADAHPLRMGLTGIEGATRLDVPKLATTI